MAEAVSKALAVVTDSNRHVPAADELGGHRTVYVIMSARRDTAGFLPSTVRLVLAACLILASGPGRAADEPRMDEEIDFLVRAVAESSCTFVRNGEEHDAARASQHLQMKRKRGKRYYDTTEQFIDRIASRSSWTGRDYLIRCGEGGVVTANEWFTNKLDEYRSTRRSSPAPPGAPG